MKRFFLLFFGVLFYCSNALGFQANLDHGTKILTITTNGDADLSQGSLGAGDYQNTAVVKVVGAISQTGLNKIETAFKAFTDSSNSWVVNNRTNNGVSSTNLDLSGATFSGTVTALPEIFQGHGCILPNDMANLSSITDYGNFNYAVSNPTDRTNGTITVWVSDGVMPGEVGITATDLANYQAGTLSVNASGPGAQDFLDALAEGDLGGGGELTAETYTINLTDSGQLAAKIAEANASGNYNNLIITGGPLSAEDMLALANVKCAKNVVMNQATVTDEAKQLNTSLGTNKKIQNLVLPKGMEEVSEEMFADFKKLNSAVSYSNDYDADNNATIKAYVKKAGTLEDALNLLNLNNTQGDLGTNGGQGFQRTKVKEVIVEGNVTAADLAGGRGAGIFNGAAIEHFDLSKAHLSESNDLMAVGNGLPALTDHTADMGYRSSLKQIELPADITEIPPYCFYTFQQLEGEIYVPNTVHTIGEKAFYKCISIESVEFQEGMPDDFSCGDYVFSECWSMKHIVLPEGLTRVSKGMFQRSYALESVRLPNSLVYIADEAFEQAEALSYLTIPRNVQYIGNKAFFNSGVKDLYLMAETPAELPVIYSIGNAGENQGTSSFGGDNVEGYNNFPPVAEFFHYLTVLVDRGLTTINPEDQADYNYFKENEGNINEKNINRWLEYLTSDEMENVYRLHAAATEKPITAIHYVDTPEMNDFFNRNPWKGDETKINSLDLSSYSDGGTRVAEEKQRYLEADYLTEAYGLGPDKFDHWWPHYNHRDYDLRVEYGYPGNAVNANDPLNSSDKADPSRLGWRQFILHSGYSPHNDDEVYSKDYDDTWYTMCFPFDLTDEQLEGAFNSNFNIVEFSGVVREQTEVEVDGETQEVNNLVLLFTNIAKTYYRDQYGNYYRRVKHEYTETVDGATVTKEEKWYHPVNRVPNGHGDYDLVDTSYDWVPSGTSYGGVDGWFTPDNAGDNLDIYESIRGVLAQGGHPYMIHPQKVEDKYGHATQCVINHIEYKYDFSSWKNKLEHTPDDPDVLQAWQEALAGIDQMYEDEKVTHHLSYWDGTSLYNAGETITGDYINLGDRTVAKLTTLDEGGSYTFKGTYLPDKYKKDVHGNYVLEGGQRVESFHPEGTEQVIPYRAYFLAVPKKANGTGYMKYPKYFREQSQDATRTTGLWKQYTAVIIPDAAAIAWEKEYLEEKEPDNTTLANSFNMAFGEFEYVSTNEIEEILQEAKENNYEVKRMNVIVNINGQVVREGLDMTGLPRGIYIVNGKKYLVR